MFRSDKSVAGLVKLFTCVFLCRINLRIACPYSEILFLSSCLSRLGRLEFFFKLTILARFPQLLKI